MITNKNVHEKSMDIHKFSNMFVTLGKRSRILKSDHMFKKMFMSFENVQNSTIFYKKSYNISRNL